MPNHEYTEQMAKLLNRITTLNRRIRFWSQYPNTNKCSFSLPPTLTFIKIMEYEMKWYASKRVAFCRDQRIYVCSKLRDDTKQDKLDKCTSFLLWCSVWLLDFCFKCTTRNENVDSFIWHPVWYSPGKCLLSFIVAVRKICTWQKLNEPNSFGMKSFNKYVPAFAIWYKSVMWS